MEQVKPLNVAIVGGGPGCKAIMDMIFAEKLGQLRMKLIGIACTNPEAMGYRYAQEKGILTTTDYRDLYKLKVLNMIIELTGRSEVANEISRTKPDHVRLMDHVAARLFWDVFQTEEKRIAERRRAEEAIQHAYSELNQIFNTAADGMRVVDNDFNVLRVNETFSAMLGISKDEAVGRKCYEAFPGPLCHTPGCPLIRVLGGEERVERDVEKQRSDGVPVPCIVTATPFLGPSGELIGIVEDFKDITHRKQAEEALRESEKKYSTLVENSLTGIYIDQDGKIAFANKRFAEIYGYSREELAGMESWRLVHPEDMPLTTEIRTKRLRGEEAPSQYEARGLTKDGWTIWINRRNTRIEYNGRPAVLGNVVDITKRKRMERALQESGKRLQFLSSNLLTAQERERRRISIELHDELGQALTVLKLQLRSIERKLWKDQKALTEDCEYTLRYVDQIIENVRRLSRDLSPSILEDLGLSAALRWVIDDVSRHYDIETSVEMEDIKDLFSQEAQIIIYRVLQEALANTGKHAHATHVSVVIEKNDGRVSFVLEDNGNGFDVEYVRSQASTEKGLGLAAMDERVRMLGGSLDIWSEEGTGTKITFTVPVDEEGNR